MLLCYVVPCALRRETPIQYPGCSRERLLVVENLKGRYRNSQNELMSEHIIPVPTDNMIFYINPASTLTPFNFLLALICEFWLLNKY